MTISRVRSLLRRTRMQGQRTERQKTIFPRRERSPRRTLLPLITKVPSPGRILKRIMIPETQSLRMRKQGTMPRQREVRKAQR